jgi:hypothetical protein
MSTITNLVEEVRQDFLKRNRDLLALTKNGPEDLMRRIVASLALNSEAQEEVMFWSRPELLDQKGYAGSVAREDFKKEMYVAVCKSFLKVQKNLVIEFVARLTPAAAEQLENIEIAGGQRPPRPIVPPPPPPLSAEEQLEVEVRKDWTHLRTAEVRRKLNNRAYKQCFDRLMAAGELKSVATLYTDGAAEFRQ